MAVLIEGISVLIKADRLLEAFRDDWNSFKATVPNSTLCADGELVRIGFMSPTEAEEYVSLLSAYGLRYIVDGTARDLTVVDQLRGPCADTPWIECGTMSSGTEPDVNVSACRLKGGAQTSLITPEGWRYEDSLTTNYLFLRTRHDSSATQSTERKPNAPWAPVEPLNGRSEKVKGYAAGTFDKWLAEKSFDKWDRGRTLHKAAVVLAALYGWQLYGLWAALAVLLGLIAATGVSYFVISNHFEHREATMWRMMRISRWLWIAIVCVGLMVSAAEVCPHDGSQCQRLINLPR